MLEKVRQVNFEITGLGSALWCTAGHKVGSTRPSQLLQMQYISLAHLLGCGLALDVAAD